MIATDQILKIEYKVKQLLLYIVLNKMNLVKKSFTHIKNWYEILERNNGDIHIILFANKVDLVNEGSINKSKIQKMVNEYKFLKFFSHLLKQAKE